MAIDQNLAKESTEASRSSAIENELPAYRAISAQAIISLLLGVLSILSIADSTFLAAAAAAVVLGILADRKIQRFPDMLTGKGFAQAGVALGLIFGLGSVTYTTVLSYYRTQSATKFAKMYIEVLKNDPIENVVWWKFPPETRKEKSPTAIMSELQKAVKDPSMLSVHTSVFDHLRGRLKTSKEEQIRFSKIEMTGSEGLEVFAAALLELTGPGSKDYPDKKQFALLLLKGKPERGKIDWYVQKLDYPYTPASYKPEPKGPPDDGHGHGGGHGH